MPYADPVKAKEYHKEYQKAYIQRDYVKVKRKEYKAEWDKRNWEYVLKKNREYSRKYRKENPERVKIGSRKSKDANREKIRASGNETASKRRVEKIRTSKFELNNNDNILKLFKLSNKKTKETGRDYHVDHIVPLQGRLVSGFHVSGNLRVILAKTNTIKHNHYTARDETLIERRMIKDWVANGVKFKLYKPKKRR